MEVFERYRRTLLSVPGVAGVAAADGKIIVYTESLESPELPYRIQGVPVEAVYSGRFRLLAFAEPRFYGEPLPPSAAEKTGRVRPAPGGVSVGHPQITAGTLGCRVFDSATGRRMILSCNHVIALQWGNMRVGKRGDPVLQPGPYDGGTISDKIGELERWVPVELEGENYVDAAVAFATPPDAVSDEVLDIGRPGPPWEPRVGDLVRKSGRSTCHVKNRVEATNATVQVWGWGVATFVDQIIVVNPFGAPGDSGSYVASEDGSKWAGLLFAGSETRTVVCKATHIARLLDIRTGAGMPYSAAGLLASLTLIVPGVVYASGRWVK